MWVVRVAAAISVALAGLCLIAACGGDGRRTYTFGASGMRATVSSLPPTASHAIAVKAERVAAKNGLVARLVRSGGGQQSVRASRWTDLDGRVLGAQVTYELRRQLMFSSDVPYIAIPPDGPARGDCVKPYAGGREHLEASGVTALIVLVDLRRGEVVDISTNARRGVVSPVAGKPYPSCQEIPAGG